MGKKLSRQTFETSRLLEFFTEKELTMQMGVSQDHWPIAILKELLDNCLDACETANIAPEIQVGVDDDGFSIEDNGPGIPEKTIRSSLDYLVRVSDKTHYISPTRGQLGNALKCVYAAPYVLDGEHGRVTIETGATKYEIDISLDRIAQEPILKLDVSPIPERRGVKIIVFMRESASLLPKDGSPYSYTSPSAFDLIRDYAMFNPHAEFVLAAYPYPSDSWEPSNTSWRKWKPDNPTSAHWYDVGNLRSLIAAYLASDSDRPLRKFIGEFRGLAGSAKQKLVADGSFAPNLNLSDLVEDGDIRLDYVETLLASMQAHSKPVKPATLGTVGKDHMAARMIEDYQVAPDSIRYKKLVYTDSMPHVLEMVFGVFDEFEKARVLVHGLNWSATLKPPVRQFNSMLAEMRIDPHDPVCIVFHLARPTFDFVDRGKGQLDV